MLKKEVDYLEIEHRNLKEVNDQREREGIELRAHHEQAMAEH